MVMVNLVVFGCIENIISLITRENSGIWDLPLYIAISVEEVWDFGCSYFIYFFGLN